LCFKTFSGGAPAHFSHFLAGQFWRDSQSRASLSGIGMIQGGKRIKRGGFRSAKNNLDAGVVEGLVAAALEVFHACMVRRSEGWSMAEEQRCQITRATGHWSGGSAGHRQTTAALYG